MRKINISLKKQGDSYNVHFERSRTRDQGIGAFVTGGGYPTKETGWKSIENEIKDIDFKNDDVLFNKAQVSSYNELLNLYKSA